MKNTSLIKIFITIFFAALIGYLTDPNASIFGVKYIELYQLIGQLFLNALTLVIVPLVASSIILGAARLGSDGSMGTLGMRTFITFFTNILIGVSIGLVISLLINPGQHTQNLAIDSSLNNSQLSALTQFAVAETTFDKIAQILYKLIPSNILAVASQGQMLGLIFFCLLFGYFSSQIQEDASKVVLKFWEGIFQIMMKITHLVMKALPFGVFGLVAKVFATTGLDSLLSVAFYTLTVLIGLSTYMFIVMPIILKMNGISPLRHFKAISPALVTAFSTSSSAATLPLTLECIEKNAHVSNRISSFTLPLGTTLNMAGSALFIMIAVLFLAQVNNYDLSYSSLALIFLLTTFSSFGLAGIPSACLVGVVLILHTLKIPGESIGLILATERVLDMCRTVVNVYGNTCSTVLIAKADGEPNILVNARERL
ncbi:Glutamate-aspartate carrier protein [Candidatus Rubidus massiliensis]|nr:MAG: dicarboxylate/amino acid:cation symporter [Chlamydia sp. 32-24]CDZ80086.1 Glutamate-aspartate carrier protein [Candidatus Rubidus massiliensis]